MENLTAHRQVGLAARSTPDAPGEPMEEPRAASSPGSALRSWLYVGTAAYFLIPCAMFLTFFTRWYIAVPVGVLLAAAWVLDARHELPFLRLRLTWSTRKVVAAIAVIVGAFAWTSLFGPGFGPQTSDQVKNMAMFRELARNYWPVTYDAGGDFAFLSYPFGYYLPAAAGEKMFGWTAGTNLLFVWAATGIALVWGWLVAFFGRFAFTAIPLFVLFSGLDVIGEVALNGAVPSGGSHLEWWATWTLFQYSSHATVMSWSMQHTAAQWLLPSLLYYRLQVRGMHQGVPLAVATAAFWSHLTLLGAFVFVPLWIYRGRARVLRDIPSWMSLPWLAVVLAFLGSKASGSIEHGWLWDLWPVQEVWPKLLLFLVLEFGVLAAITYVFSPPWSKSDRILLGTALTMLLVVPLYSVGWSNDVSMRVSGIPLFVLFLFAMFSLRSSVRLGQRGPLIVFGGYFLIASFTPINEMSRQLTLALPERFFVSDITDESWDRGIRRGDGRCFQTSLPTTFDVRAGDSVRLRGVPNALNVSSATSNGGTADVCLETDEPLPARLVGDQRVRFLRDGEELGGRWRWTDRHPPEAYPSILDISAKQYVGAESSFFYRHVLR